MSAERRRRIREEISLIVPAVFIAIVVWAIAQQQKLETNWLNDISVTLINVPPNMVVTPNPDVVRIQVRYPGELHNSAVARNFGFSIDASRIFRTEPDQTQPQTATYQLAPRDIDKQNVPEAIQVVEVVPAKIQLTAILRTTTATVETVTTGQLPRNMELTDKPQARPAEVVVTGSIEALQALRERGKRIIKTTPIDLGQVQASCEVYPKLVLPEGIQLVGQQNQVTVNIGITERMVRRIYHAVAVTVPLPSDTMQAKLKPETVSVEVEGPESALRQLTKDDFEVYPARDPAAVADQVQRIGIEAHMKKAGNSPLVRMVRCIPNTIEVQFSARTPAQTPKPTPKPARPSHSS
ncbi:hypothetical protein LLG95_15420 [bacterium]|nr:hypothetical protein [bacterium]